jgi:hypothetical protein
MRIFNPRVSWLFLPSACFAAALMMGCPEQPSSAPDRESKATPEKPQALPIGSDAPRLKGFQDQTAVAEKREPWDNYILEDPLSLRYIAEGKSAPYPQTKAWPRYQEDFVGSALQDGQIDFKIVGNLYREGLVVREKRAALTAQFQARVDASPEKTEMKANFILAMIHIGFEKEAFALIAKYRDAEWFSKHWDVNFFAGTLFFRHRRYAEATPFLRTAMNLNPDAWSRLWLKLALQGTEGTEEERAGLFDFGPHMGEGSAEGLPFKEVADFMGIRRWHLAGAIAFADYNNDTFVDFVANGVYATPELYLFENGKGFVRKEDKTLAGASNVPPACVAADFDNDGWTDLYMTRAAWLTSGPNRLLKNDGGKGFVDMSTKGDAALAWQNSCGASALDFDRDGLLDLAVTGTAGGRVVLLRNKGDFEFEDVSSAAGIEENKAVTVGVSTGDVNGDGFTDMFVNSLSPVPGPKRKYEAPNALYMNQGDGTFKEEAAVRGVADGTPFGFSSWMFDYDGDGDLDILAANFVEGDAQVLAGYQKERKWEGLYWGPALYKNDGTGNFVNVAPTAGFIPASVMGAQFIDYDLDGDMDVILGPGSHPLKDMQPLFIYRNEGGDKFTNVTPLDDPLFFGKFHGMAFVDHDRDGDPDLYVNNGGILLSDRWRDLFLENTTEGMHWLHVKLVGTTANRSAVGARITATFGDRKMLQEVSAGEGFSSTNTPYLIFGLGQSATVDRLQVEWPGGETEVMTNLAADQAIVVTQGTPEPRRVY